MSITEDGTCRYSYSLNGSDFKDYGDAYSVQQGTWIGAKLGLICLSPSLMESKGYADFEFFRFGSQR
ncbi:hypothetical protein [Arcticibacter sp. MXS-1]|uniref:beta-xylosidase family glycoside hydrolase n=1 Tax=Arcticibacter sp. MXS-1 TaxID=3341726 RepID=UPI0035A88D85